MSIIQKAAQRIEELQRAGVAVPPGAAAAAAPASASAASVSSGAATPVPFAPQPLTGAVPMPHPAVGWTASSTAGRDRGNYPRKGRPFALRRRARSGQDPV